MSRRSSRRGWPETCTRWVRSVMTSMPCSTRPLMMPPTAFSLPGMVREEKITQSPLLSVTCGWSSLATRAQRQHLVGRKMAVEIGAAESLHSLEIAGLARHLHHTLHGAADHDHLA